MGLKAGIQEDFEGSMAEAMECAFEHLWEAQMGTTLPREFLEDRRVVFIAIAQGVVRHLVDNAGAFNVDVSVVQGRNLITSSGSMNAANSQGGTTTYQVTVTQDDTAKNKVKSAGTGKVNRIETTGTLYSPNDCKPQAHKD